MSSVMFVLAFVGSIVAYCAIAFVLSAFISILLENESPFDDIWFELCITQFTIALVVMAIYFPNMFVGTT